MISMLIDHVGFVFFPYDLEFRYIGRIAFPIYCFLLVEGFYHTSNVGKYMLRLGLFALISEIPFNLGLYHTLICTRGTNVFFTLFIGILVMYAAQLARKQTGSSNYGIFICMAGMAVAYYLRTDYSYTGILMIYGFYLAWEARNFGTDFSRSLATAMLCLFEAGIFILHTGTMEDYAIFSLPFILLYSGKKSGIIWEKTGFQKHDKFFQYLFYAYYPLHLMGIYLIWALLMKN